MLIDGAIDALNARINPGLNNGTCRTSFATTQLAYQEASADLVAMLGRFEEVVVDGVTRGSATTRRAVSDGSRRAMGLSEVDLGTLFRHCPWLEVRELWPRMGDAA